MAAEARRACGYRKVGGMYLVTEPHKGRPCCKLPLPLTVCPTCSAGIKQTRAPTWIDIGKFFDGECQTPPCPLMLPEGRGLLVWVGERFYPTPEHFLEECRTMGMSKRIAALPNDFVSGETPVLLAHPKTVPVVRSDGSSAMGPAIFRVMTSVHVEKIVTETESQDEVAMARLERRGIRPVVVPDDDPDHRGTVYDKEDTCED